MPDSDRNRSWLGKKITQLGIAGYPALRIVALAETGTRGLLGAVIGSRGERSEVPLARKLVPLLREGMLLLADRGYDTGDLMTEISATGAHFLIRGTAARKPAVTRSCPTGPACPGSTASGSGSSRQYWTCTAPTEPGSGTAAG